MAVLSRKLLHFQDKWMTILCLQGNTFSIVTIATPLGEVSEARIRCLPINLHLSKVIPGQGEIFENTSLLAKKLVLTQSWVA